ncbi:cupredoxin domain-containing protein [Pseudoalteromonas sp. YIC-656]|uniref:cupredoxin domain-containing protein n=1 Tax=Pseudoalteromonas pernae TaxID=3118054 RepID=UPI003242DBE7
MIIVNLIGFALIGVIVWWFWLYKPTNTVIDAREVQIEVADGVYTPSSIQVKAGQSVTLNFKREDQSPCAETVLFPALDISEQLPIGEVTSVTLNDLTPGEYAFHCQMQMYRGMLKVVE